METIEKIKRIMDGLLNGKPYILNQVVSGAKNMRCLDSWKMVGKTEVRVTSPNDDFITYPPYAFEYYDIETNMMLIILFAVYKTTDSWYMGTVVPVQLKSGIYTFGMSGILSDPDLAPNMIFASPISKDHGDNLLSNDNVPIYEKNIEPEMDMFYKYLNNLYERLFKYIKMEEK